MDGRLTWTDCEEAGDYVVPNVLSPKDLVFRPDNMDETVPHPYSPTCVDLIGNPENRFSNDEAQLSEASVEKEDDHKFMYVMKGPARAKQKKVFYVYGKGWGAKDGAVVKPTATKEMGQDPTWPLRQHPNDVYYDIRVLDHGNMWLLLSFSHKTTFNGPSCRTFVFVCLRLYVSVNYFSVILGWLSGFNQY